MNKWLDEISDSSQLTLGLILGYVPIVFLALINLIGLKPNPWVLGLYCLIAGYFFWTLRFHVWLNAGLFFGLANLLPLYLFSGHVYWEKMFGPGVFFGTMVVCHLPLLVTLGDSLGTVKPPSNKYPALEIAQELIMLAVPWFYLLLVNRLGLAPFGGAMLAYLALISVINMYYARHIMIPSMTRSYPQQSVFMAAAFFVWCYVSGFMLACGLSGNRYYSLIYSDNITLATVSVYYAVFFLFQIVLHITKSAEISAAVKDEEKRRAARTEELNRWFERQKRLREEEKIYEPNPAESERERRHDLVGLPLTADADDLDQARQYWDRRYNPYLTRNYSKTQSEDLEKIKQINETLDIISKGLTGKQN